MTNEQRQRRADVPDFPLDAIKQWIDDKSIRSVSTDSYAGHLIVEGPRGTLTLQAGRQSSLTLNEGEVLVCHLSDQFDLVEHRLELADPTMLDQLANLIDQIHPWRMS